MKLFNLFKKSDVTTVTRYQMISDNGQGFYSWNGNLYQSDIVRACIRPYAKAVGKLIAKHIREVSEDEYKVNPEPYIKFLLEEPNPIMTGQKLQEKVAVQLKLNNNAFILIIRDEVGYPCELYPLPANYVEQLKDKQGFIYLKFHFWDGREFTFAYSDIIHLRNDFNESEVFGDNPAPALAPLMDIVTTTDQGIVKAIKNSSAIKWLLKFNQSLRPEDIKAQTKKFVDDYLNIDSELGGAAAADAKYDAKQVDPKDYVPNATQMKETTKRIYAFFNTNEKIVHSDYSEDEWNAYYESEIEPVAIDLAGEYTRKLFSRRERGFGNSIVFESSSLQYASMSTKLQLVQMVDRGAMTPNQWRKILGLAPIEGGEKPIRRLDTATVSEVKGGDK